MVTFGIKPYKPETGYGYMQSKNNEVIAFHEKPTLEKAMRFISDGNYFWNSGIFCFKAKTYLDELALYRPDILKACQETAKLKVDAFLDYESSALIPA
jgi:mannose-1-phosphate guanylyltransferase